MKILHVLDHSIPWDNAFTRRTCAVIRAQRRRGWLTCQLTSTAHGEVSAGEEEVAGLHFYRTAAQAELLHRWSVMRERACRRDLWRRMRNVIRVEDPDLVHAYSPAVVGLAALSVCLEFELPLLYELHSDLQQRDVWLCRRADHVAVLEAGVKHKLCRSGISPGHISVIEPPGDGLDWDSCAAAYGPIYRRLLSVS